MGPLVLSQQGWLYAIFLLSAVLVFGNGIHYLLFRLLRRQQGEKPQRSLGIQKYLAWPARGVFLTIGSRIILPLVPRIPAPVLDRVEQPVECLLVLLVGWLAIGGVYVFQAVTLSRFDTTVADNLRARSVHIQNAVLPPAAHWHCGAS